MDGEGECQDGSLFDDIYGRSDDDGNESDDEHEDEDDAHRPMMPTEAPKACLFQSCQYIQDPDDGENAMTIHVETRHSMLRCFWCDHPFYRDGFETEAQDHLRKRHRQVLLQILGIRDDSASVAKNVVAEKKDVHDGLRYSSNEEEVDETPKTLEACTTKAIEEQQGQEVLPSLDQHHSEAAGLTETHMDQMDLDKEPEPLPTTQEMVVSDHPIEAVSQEQVDNAETTSQDFVPSANMFCSRCFRRVTGSAVSGSVTTDDMKFHTDPFRSCRIADQLGSTEDLPNRSGWLRGRDVLNRRQLRSAFLKKYPGYIETVYPHQRSSMWKFDPNNETYKHVWGMPWPPVEGLEAPVRAVKGSESAPGETTEAVPQPQAEHEHSEVSRPEESEMKKPEESGINRPEASEAAVPESQSVDEPKAPRSPSPKHAPKSPEDRKRKRNGSSSMPISPPISPRDLEHAEADLPPPKRSRQESDAGIGSSSDSLFDTADVEASQLEAEESTNAGSDTESRPHIESKSDDEALRSSPVLSPTLEAAPKRVDVDLPSPKPTQQSLNLHTDLQVEEQRNEAEPSSQRHADDELGSSRAPPHTPPVGGADVQVNASTPQQDSSQSIAGHSFPESQPQVVVNLKRKRSVDELNDLGCRDGSPVTITIDEHGFPRLTPAPSSTEAAEPPECSINSPDVIAPGSTPASTEKPKRKRRKRDVSADVGEPRNIPWNLRSRNPAVRY